MTEYKCFNCGAELRVDGKWLQCDVEDCMSKYPLDRYDDPAVIIVRNCWECPRRFRGGVNACEPLDKEFGAMIGCGPLEDCPLKRLSELKKSLKLENNNLIKELRTLEEKWKNLEATW